MTMGFAGRSIRSQVVSTDDMRSAFDIAGSPFRRLKSLVLLG